MMSPQASKQEYPQQRLDRELRALEAEAEAAMPGLEGPLYNRAGDLCERAGLGERAQRYYGQAIDAYLASGRYDPAGAVCRKLLRLRPRAVRPRCTLAWIAIGKAHRGDATREIEGYADAARRAGQARYAVRQLRMMAEVVEQPELRELLAAKLDELGDAEAAADVRAGLIAPGGPNEPEPHAGDPWARVLRAALMGPKQLDE